MAAKIRAAVAGVVKKQVDSGVDLVNDGEMSKPSYATYVKDRLTGFAGSSNTFVYQDLSEFPNLAMRVFGDPGDIVNLSRGGILLPSVARRFGAEKSLARL